MNLSINILLWISRKTRKKDHSFIFEMHKVLTRAYFKKHFFFVDIQNGEIVVALLKHRDKPDIKLDRLYSSRGDNKMGDPQY